MHAAAGLLRDCSRASWRHQWRGSKRSRVPKCRPRCKPREKPHAHKPAVCVHQCVCGGAVAAVAAGLIGPRSRLLVTWKDTPLKLNRACPSGTRSRARIRTRTRPPVTRRNRPQIEPGAVGDSKQEPPARKYPGDTLATPSCRPSATVMAFCPAPRPTHCTVQASHWMCGWAATV